MTDKVYTEEDLTPLDAITGIRGRPEMYVGPLADPATINSLLTESLCIAFDNAVSGCATNIAVSFHADGSASVRDNGPGLNVEIVHDGLTAIEILLTKIYACREVKRNQIHQSLCRFGIVCTNALSEWLTVEVVQDGWLWKQRYVRGYAEAPIEKLSQQAQTWQQIRFLPDRDIFGDAMLAPDYLVKWFQRLPLSLLEATSLTLIDERSGTTKSLLPST
jgi:DNA gyrase subunit B